MTETGENPKDRLGLKKPPLRLVPPAALLYMAKVMGLGAAKYGPYNWRQKKVRYTVYLEAAMRHILSALDGEEIDPESGQPHVAHAAACMAIVLDAKATGNLVDDRPTPGVAAKLIAEMTEKDVPVGSLDPQSLHVTRLDGPYGDRPILAYSGAPGVPEQSDPCGRPEDCEAYRVNSSSRVSTVATLANTGDVASRGNMSGRPEDCEAYVTRNKLGSVLTVGRRIDPAEAMDRERGRL